MISKLITGLKSIYSSIRLNIGGWVVYQAAMESVNVTTIAGTFAQLSLLGKIKAVTAALWEQVSAFLATPAGIATVVIGLTAATTAFTDAWQKQVEAAQEAISKSQENIQTYQSELDSLEQLAEKLKEAQGDKKALAAIQGELNETIGDTTGLINGESQAYELATKKIQAQIQAKKDLIAQEQSEIVKANSTIYEKQGIKKSFIGIDWLAQDIPSSVLQGYAKQWKGDLDKAFTAVKWGYDLSLSKEDWDKYWQSQIKVAQDVFQKTISNYSGFGGSDFLNNIIADAVKNGYSLPEIEAIIKGVSDNDIQPLLDKYILSLDDPNTDSESIYKTIQKQLDELKKKYPELSTTIDTFSKAYINNLNKVEKAAEEAEISFKSIAKTLSDGLDKLSNKKDILSEVKEELDEFGAISADNISKILEQFSDNDDVQKAVAYYLSGIGTAQQLYDVMAKGYQNDLQLQAQELASKMQNDEKYYEAIGGLNESFTNWLSSNYNVDLKNCTTLAKTKLEVENSLINTFKNNWSKYYQWANNISSANINSEIARIEKLFPKGYTNPLLSDKGRANIVKNDPVAKLFGADYYQRLYTAWSQLKDIANGNNSATKELEKLISKNFNTTGFKTTLSTDFDKDSGKTAAEKYFDKQKYLLETNQITQEEYLKRINQKYKEFYKNQGDDLEDYAKYSQEVYDGFKDMYKEDLEAQKEAWEEKKDAVSEYYDNLREQIEDAHDKEDYEKEQSEKRKEIFDLDMQIAELMRDGSEKAKARIAELEEERLKAEEELLDFETNKAREDELSRLEKEQEAEEKKIQDKIDGVQKKLDKLDEDTISVRNAIIAYAKEKGVTLNFAYASGTRSSVGGFGRINEKGIEMISAPDGNGNYIPMLPNSYVFSAKATEFLWKLATEHSLPQAMYNSIAKSIKTQSSTPSVNIAQPINITMGDVIIKGNADKQTVVDIKKQQEDMTRAILLKIKELQK